MRRALKATVLVVVEALKTHSFLHSLLGGEESCVLENRSPLVVLIETLSSNIDIVRSW